MRMERRYVSPSVVRELLRAEGIETAALSDKALLAQWDKAHGQFMRFGFRKPFSTVMKPGYLPGDRKGQKR